MERIQERGYATTIGSIAIEGTLHPVGLTPHLCLA